MRYHIMLILLAALPLTACTSVSTASAPLPIQSHNELQKIKENLTEIYDTEHILTLKQIFFNGYQSYQSSDWGKAVYFFEQTPDSYLLSDYALYYKALALSNLNRYYEALLSFDKIVNKYQDSPLAPLSLLNIGNLLLDTGNYQNAAKYFKKFIDAFPNHKEIPQVLYKLAINLETIGESDNAQTPLKQLWIEYPTDRYTKLTSQPILTADEAYRRIQNLFEFGEHKIVIKEAVLNEERFIMISAKSFYHARDYEMAIKNLKSIVNNTTDNGLREEAMLWLGKAYANIKNAEKAQTAYRELLGAYPKGRYAEEALYKTAVLAKEQDNITSALEILERLAKEYPSSQFGDDSIWQMAWITYEKGEYKKALKYLKFLENSSDRFKKRAIYWHGKVLLKLGNKDEAVNVFKKLCAGEQNKTAASLSEILPSYYEILARGLLIDLGMNCISDCGFWASDYEFRKENSFNYPAVTSKTSLDISYSENMRIKKADELISLNLREQAYIELASLGDRTSVNDIIHAGILYKKAGDINRSHNIGRNLLRNVKPPQPAVMDTDNSQIVTLLLLAYPLGYQSIVDAASEALQIAPYLAYAVITQESGFNEMAVSRAGALGLMQIMPKTGKAISEKLSINNFKKEDLFSPQINITLGANYLKGLIEEFKGNIALALAAYNAGPSAVKSWLKKRENLDTDEFVENIPYNETRKYVERVLNVYETYKAIYSNESQITNKTDYTLMQAIP